MRTAGQTRTPNDYYPPLDDEKLVETVLDAGKKVSPYALYEIAADPYPPRVVQEVIEAVCLLLGLQLDWGEVKKLIMEEKLHKMIEEFHPECVPNYYLEQISEIAHLDEMQLALLDNMGLGVVQLGEWLHAIALYYDVKHKPELFQQPVTVEPEVQREPTPEPEPVVETKEEPPKETPPARRIISIKEALESIKNLNKQDITEVKGYKKPPAGVLLVLEALCILFDAMKVEKKGNQVIYDPLYKKLLQDPDEFIRKVLNLDFDMISLDKIKRLRTYIVKPEFEIEKVKRASKAAASFSLLIISIVQKYDEQQTS